MADKKMYIQPTEEEITSFADRHLSPWAIRHGELIAKTCPYCNGGESGDTGTFYISLQTGQYCCHRGKCGVRGGWVSLLRRFGEAGNIASVTKGLKPLNVTPLPRTEAIDEYFAGRGISAATLDRYQVSATSDGNIMFPFFVEGELVYAKYRQPTTAPVKRKEWAQAGASPVLFGMDLCRPDEPLTITEGQIDSLSLSEAGITNVVSVPSGCENFDWVEPCFDWLERFGKIILFGDSDPPGLKMIRTLVARLGEEKCFVVENYPEGCKDANDILVKYGVQELREAWESAKEVPIQGMINLADVENVDPTSTPRVSTMIPKLDEYLNALGEGELTVFTGESGNGKSTLCGTLLLAAIEQGKTVCAVSLELSASKFKEWIDCQAAGSQYITLKYDPLRKKQIPVVYPPAAERIHEWYNNKFFLYEGVEDSSLSVADSIMKVFTAAAKRRGCKIFLVDNLMTALMDSIEDENRSQARFMAQLKRFAVKFSAHVIVVAHPRKVKDGATITKDDVGGSKYITNLASNVCVIERPNIRVIKARDTGMTGYIECCYCGDSRRVYQADVGDKYQFSWDKTGLTPPNIRADSLPEYGIYHAALAQMF